MTTNAYFGPNLAVSGQNPYFLGVCKRGKPPREKPSTRLVRIVFWSGMEPLGPKLPINQKRPNLAKNWHFWSIWARPCRLILCPVGGSFGGCGVRDVSRKTPIYFMGRETTTSWLTPWPPCSSFSSIFNWICSWFPCERLFGNVDEEGDNFVLANTLASLLFFLTNILLNFLGASMCVFTLASMNKLYTC